MLCRSIPKAQQLLSDGTWSGWGPNKTLGQSINGKKLGLLEWAELVKQFLQEQFN